MFTLGSLYFYGTGVTKDTDKAYDLFIKAGQKGDASALRMLGYMFYNGKGVNKDTNKAVSYFEQAVEKGSTFAMVTLGKMYEKGNALPKDSDKALELYTKAAENSDSSGQYELGRMLYSVQNYTASFKWFKQSAEQNNKNALYMVGAMYHNGDGMKYDSDTAAQWFSKSVRSGSQDGLDALMKLEKTGNSVAKQELCSLYKDQKIGKDNYIDKLCKGQ